MIVQFEKPQCFKHKLPLIYICDDFNCTCGVRLCLKCAQDHKHKTDIEDDFLK